MLHWWIERITSVALLFLVPFTIFVDARFIVVLAACLAVHVHHGFDSIFMDYVHNDGAKKALLNLITLAVLAAIAFVVCLAF
jgi:succinate dehydrogenase hydrophobic anchor subunit